VSEKFHADLMVAYVKQPNISPEDQAALDSHIAAASAAGAEIEILEGHDPAEALLQFARSRGVTQLYVGHTRRKGMDRFKGGPLDKLIWEGHGMDVRIFPGRA
jgi:two-component system sensor histidine kinase KdpD